MVTVGCGCFLGATPSGPSLHWAFGRSWFRTLPRPLPSPCVAEGEPEMERSIAEEPNSEAPEASDTELPVPCNAETASEETAINEQDCPDSPASYVALRKAFREAPREELSRFAVGWPKASAAVAAYEDHRKWREMSQDENLQAREEVPQWISRGRFLAKDESPVLLLQIARTDCKKAPELYFKALCCSIDEQLSGSEFQRITVLLDVRAGAGWPNPKPHELLPLLRIATRMLPLHYPGVLHRIILYPVPVAAALFTRMALAFVDSITRSRVCLISERSKGGFEKHLEKYVSKESLPPYAWERHPNLS
mmetsp:Transcript_90040/g.143300  ORF Transcript_90040/g.143300 Transcript_90040/m.143300 type:complete len:308 (-) Transcript_90040:16-939(-)